MDLTQTYFLALSLAAGRATPLTDVDAITLSTVQLVRAGRIEAEIGWRLMLIGVMANLVFKAAAAAGVGDPRLRP